MAAAESSPEGVEQRDLEAVLAGYERWNSGDFAGLADLFAEDITYQNAPEWPGQRVYEGSEAVTSFLENEVAKIIALRPVEIMRTSTHGAEILIELQARTRGFLSGLDIEDVAVFHVATVRDGKVSRVRVYLNREEAVQAAESGTD